MRRLLFEIKVIGVNAWLIFTALTLVLLLVAIGGGELLNVSVLGFEVIYPFLTAIAVGEWGKTRADANFDIVAAQGKSLFQWTATKFCATFLLGSLFALLGMALVFFARKEMAIGEMLWLYFPPAFFLSTLCAFFGICCGEEHIATLISGTFWLLSMLARGLLRVPGVEYFYLFIRHAGDINGIWRVNKTLLAIMGFGLWAIIYLLCKKRAFAKKSITSAPIAKRSLLPSSGRSSCFFGRLTRIRRSP